jgi:hypothetical protein
MLIGLALLALVFEPSILCAAPAGGVAFPPVKL